MANYAANITTAEQLTVLLPCRPVPPNRVLQSSATLDKAVSHLSGAAS